MPTATQLCTANLNALYNARVSWAALLAALEGAQRDAGAKVGGPLRASNWVGLSADAAYRNLDRLSDDLLHATVQARLVYTLLDDIHEFFHASQQQLRRLLDTTADEHADKAIAELLRTVNETDERYAAALRQLDVIPRTDTNSTSWQGHAQDRKAVAALSHLDLSAVPRNDPAAAAAWWASLTEDQRHEYIAFAPRLIGMTDGLPAAVRDQANRLALKEERSALQRQLDQLNRLTNAPARSNLPPQYRDPRNVELAKEELRRRLDGITALERVLDYQLGEQENPYGQAVPPAFLLSYSTEGNGRAVVALGNPDTADNVVINVPGTGAKLADLAGAIDRTSYVLASATIADPRQPTSSILWMGYDAPQNLVKDSTREVFAENGAPRLARFDAGLDAAREADPAHTTVIAHSYGSLVAGRALEHEGMQVDRFVIIGSPGVGAEHVSELGLPAEHVYAGTIPNDPVDDWALPVHDPRAILDIAEVRYGKNPTSDDFGAQDLPVNRAPGGSGLFNFDAHSTYWQQDSASLMAMGQIVVGRRP